MSVRLVVGQTIRESVRNRELPGMVGLFVLVFGALGGLWAHLEPTGIDTSNVLTFTIYLNVLIVPMIGLSLGTGLVAGPREDGRLRLLLGQPISRLSFVVGGYVAKATVLVVTIAAGGAAIVVAAVGLGADFPVDAYARFVPLTIGVGLAYLGMSVAISTLFRTTDWTVFATFATFFVFVLVWRLVPSGYVLVANGFEYPHPEPAWVSLVEGFSPSVAYEYLVHTYVVEGTVPGGPGEYDSPLIYAGVLCWWIVLVPALAYWRFDSSDL